MEIISGHVYRAKRPKPAGFPEAFNDRMVVYVSELRVQYDSSTVRNGRKYPMVDRDKFEKWAAKDITEGYPEGDWAPWPPRTNE